MNSVNYFAKTYYIIIFKHRDHVYVMDDYLKRNRMYKYQIVPTPCGIKKGCSYSLKTYSMKDIEVIKDTSGIINTPIDSVFRISKKDKNSKRVIRELKYII